MKLAIFFCTFFSLINNTFASDYCKISLFEVERFSNGGVILKELGASDLIDVQLGIGAEFGKFGHRDFNFIKIRVAGRILKHSQSNEVFFTKINEKTGDELDLGSIKMKNIQSTATANLLENYLGTISCFKFE